MGTEPWRWPGRLTRSSNSWTSCTTPNRTIPCQHNLSVKHIDNPALDNVYITVPIKIGPENNLKTTDIPMLDSVSSLSPVPDYNLAVRQRLYRTNPTYFFQKLCIKFLCSCFKQLWSYVLYLDPFGLFEYFWVELNYHSDSEKFNKLLLGFFRATYGCSKQRITDTIRKTETWDYELTLNKIFDVVITYIFASLIPTECLKLFLSTINYYPIVLKTFIRSGSKAKTFWQWCDSGSVWFWAFWIRIH